jgi:hypothetical protein
MSGSSHDAVHVYDTWVQGKNGLLHFDVMTTDETTALKLAKRYLDGLGEHEVTVTLKECQFCHSEPLVLFSAEQQMQFEQEGGFILPLPV